MPVCVILNPSAQGGRARRWKSHWISQGTKAVLRPTSCPGDARRLAREAVLEHFDTIIAAGGDGTLNQVAQGIVESGPSSRNVSMGILPLGTVNVYAQELGLPAELDACWHIATMGPPRKVDLVEIVDTTSRITEPNWMLQLGGAGLDARAVELADYRLKQRIGRFAYVWASCQALRQSRGRIRVETSEGFAVEAEQVFVGKGSRFGGNRQLFPKARLDDGLIHFHAIPKASWREAARLAAWFAFSRQQPPPVGVPFSASEARMLPMDGARVPFEIDGDFAGTLPRTLRVARQSLNIRAPR